MARTSLKKSEYKALITISMLNKIKDFPNHLGLYKILKGVRDEETLKYEYLPTFSTLVSLTSRKAAGLASGLEKKGLIKRFFDERSHDLFFKITDDGIKEVSKYALNHDLNFEKRRPNIKKTIIHIE